MQDFKIVSVFKCAGRDMITVRIGNAAHVMGLEEWKNICCRSLKHWDLNLEWDNFMKAS